MTAEGELKRTREARNVEPVARLLHRIKPPYEGARAIAARTYDECHENAYPDTWREGDKLYGPEVLDLLAAEKSRADEMKLLADYCKAVANEATDDRKRTESRLAKVMEALRKFTEELARLSDAATQGEWEVFEHSWSDTSVIAVGGGAVCNLSILHQATEETQDALEAQMKSDANLIALLANRRREILALVRAAKMTLDTLPHMGGNEMSSHNLAMALSEALVNLDEVKP